MSLNRLPSVCHVLMARRAGCLCSVSWKWARGGPGPWARTRCTALRPCDDTAPAALLRAEGTRRLPGGATEVTPRAMGLSPTGWCPGRVGEGAFYKATFLLPPGPGRFASLGTRRGLQAGSCPRLGRGCRHRV